MIRIHWNLWYLLKTRVIGPIETYTYEDSGKIPHDFAPTERFVEIEIIGQVKTFHQ